MPLTPTPSTPASPTAPASRWPGKYAWRMVTRQTQPKRAALERSHDFYEIYSLYDEKSVREQASRCLQCPDPTCRTGCPLCNRIPEWLALTAEGKYLEAAAIAQSTSNFPELCARVCPQERLCESACFLNGVSDPVSIGAIERFIMEFAFAHGGIDTTTAAPNGLRVAIVGAGPGGLACADELAKTGHAVTVFEALGRAGGLLMYGIPSFKLEKDFVERRVEVLRARGIQFRFGMRLGRDLTLTRMLEDFDAVFLGIGAQLPKAIDVPGENLAGVHQAIPFLVQTNAGVDFQGPPIDVQGKRVVVLGGGDSAMDCLRSAIRSNASAAVCLYRRDLANMPGSRKEYYNALEEGAEFQFLTNPIEIVGDANGRVTGVRCLKMELGEPDAGGRRKPRPVPGSENFVAADVVLGAYGFDPVPFPEGSDLARIAVNDWFAVTVDDNQMSSIPGVFAGGDLVRGANLVVNAVRAGRRAAAGIERYLREKKR